MKVYVVFSNRNYMRSPEFRIICSSEEKAENFIKECVQKQCHYTESPGQQRGYYWDVEAELDVIIKD